MTGRDELPILQVDDAEGWHRWLAEHPDAPGVWLKVAKKGVLRRTVSYPEAVRSALCFGWIDGQGRPLDEHHWLQRFTPRRRRSRWSRLNRERAEELIAAGAMQPAGLAQVEAAKRDGRWDAAYEPPSQATVPEDLQRELDRHPRAKAFFATLSGVNRYALLYRIGEAKRPQTRANRIAKFVAMLEAGETFYP